MSRHLKIAHKLLFVFVLLSIGFFLMLPFTDNSTNNNENTSPSLTPPPSASSKSPQPHPAFSIQKEGIESDDEHEIIEEDDEDSTEGRNTENASPNSLQNKRKKKTRTVFSRAQVFQLESTFDLKRYD